MNIKTRLTMQFGTLSTLFLAATFIVIFILTENYRKEEFYARLLSRSTNIAKLLLEVDEIDEFLLYKIEKDNPIRLPSEAIQVFNFKNELLFEIDDADFTFVKDNDQLDQIRLDSIVMFHSGERESVGYLFTSRYDRFVILASAIDVYGHRKMKNLRNILLIVFVIGVIFTFITSRFFAIKAIEPVKQLNHDIGEINPTDLSKRLAQASGNNELAELAQSFNHMMDLVEDAFKTRKNFIANASHEMRTPLTAISGQLEVLALKDRTTEEYKAGIESVIDDMHSLNRLANRLLILAQTENDEVVKSFASTRIDEIVWQSAKDLKKLHKTYEVNIDFDESIDDEEILTVNGSEMLLKTVLFNLMENGCKYSDDHQSTVLLTKNESGLLMAFTDHGIGIPEKDLPQIFNPFFRGSNVGKIRGHGIGLSLVKRIIDMHQAEITIQSSQQGTMVLVQFFNS